MRYIKLFEQYQNENLEDWAYKELQEWHSGSPTEDNKKELELFLNSDFPEGIKNIPNNIKLYRVFGLEEGDEINYDNIGTHFVADENILDDEFFLLDIGFSEDELDELDFINIGIETSKDSLDLHETILNRIKSPNELEYTIKNNVDYKIV